MTKLVLFAALVSCCGCAGRRSAETPPTRPAPASSSHAAETSADSTRPATRSEEGTRAFCRVLPCAEQRVVRRILERAELFDRFVCKAGMEASVATDGRLVACMLAGSITIDGLLLAAGTFIRLDPDGHVADMTLTTPRDFLLPNGTSVRCGKGDISFAQQHVVDCVLGAPFKGNGVRCRVGESVSFHPEGALASATVEDPVPTAELTFAPGARVDWSADGHVRGGTLTAPVEARGLELAYAVELHPNGALALVHLRRDATIQGHRFPALAKITFRADRTLAAAEYTEKMGTMIHGEPWTDTRRMTFDPRGAVLTSYLEHFQATVRPPR